MTTQEIATKLKLKKGKDDYLVFNRTRFVPLSFRTEIINNKATCILIHPNGNTLVLPNNIPNSDSVPKWLRSINQNNDKIDVYKPPFFSGFNDEIYFYKSSKKIDLLFS